MSSVQLLAPSLLDIIPWLQAMYVLIYDFSHKAFIHTLLWFCFKIKSELVI